VLPDLHLKRKMENILHENEAAGVVEKKTQKLRRVHGLKTKMYYTVSVVFGNPSRR